jgi:DNA-binding SARP family transcriptional activator
MLTPLSPLRPRSPAAPNPSGMTALLRHRLTDQLADRRFAAVLSQPGHGRTTLLAQAARLAGGAVSWYRARPAADPAEHRLGLLRALLDRPPTNAELAGTDAVLAALEHGGQEGRLVLVDDVHLLDWDSRELLLRVGRHGPAQPRLLVAGLPAEGVDAATFEAAGASVLGTGELRFRSFEVERLFRVCFGAPLPPDAVLPLAAYTRGQAAALHRLASGGGVAAQALAVPRPAAPPGPAAARVLGGYLGGAPPRLSGSATGRLPAGGDIQVGYATALGGLWRALVEAGPGGPVPIAEVHRVAFQAELDREDWASRAARCLLGLGQHQEDVEQLPAARWECQRLGEQVTGTFAALVDAVGSVRAGRPSALALEVAVAGCRAAGWTDAEAWSRAALALVEVTLDVPDAAERAGQAEAFARVAGTPGAQVLAISAVAQAGTRERPDLLQAAWSIAESAGLDTELIRSWISALTQGAGQPEEALSVPALPAPRLAPLADYPEPPPVSIRCLGGFCFEIGGTEPDWSRLRPGSLALLRALAAHAGEPVHRTQLIEWFWPELTPTRALHNLQVSVSRLRMFLEPGVPRGQARLIARRGEAYHLLLPPGSRCDVVRFEHAVRAGRLARTLGRVDEATAAFRQALEEYAGELLPEGGSAEWLLRERDRLRQEAAEAAATLAALELGRDRPCPAEEAARRAVKLDRYSDQGWQALIAALEQAGHTAAAGRARQQYAEVLAALGFGPDGAVRSTA